MPTKAPPKETPLDLTRQVRDISVTERNSFKSCRRRWLLETIENLEPRGVRNWAFDFGTGIHAGLEAYYKRLGGLLSDSADPLEWALVDFDDWYEQTDAEIVKAGLGALEGPVRDELLEYKELGEGMLVNYSLYAPNEDDFTVCCVEGKWTEKGLAILERERAKAPYGEEAHPILHPSGRLLVPIVDPATGECLPGRPYLSSRLDLIVWVSRTGHKGFWVQDHKTSGSTPSDRGMDMDDQFTGYGYNFWRLTGIYPRGTFANYLIKQLPKEPRIVRDGQELSFAKDQLTTPDLYKEAMKEFGLIDKTGRITSKKHEECYAALLSKGWRPFFQRFQVPRNEHEYKMFEMRLPVEYSDMKEAQENPEKAYPHLSQYNCPGCPVARICHAIEDGSDYEDVIETSFQQAKDRKA